MSQNFRPSIHSPVHIFLEDNLCQEARAVLVGACHALELIEEAATITLPDRRFIYVNSAFERLYGITSATMLGNVKLPIHTKSVSDQLIDCIYSQTLAGGWRGNLENRAKSGKPFDIELRTKPLTTAAGKVVGYMGICHPTTWQRMPLEPQIPAAAPVKTPEAQSLEILSKRERDVLLCYGLGLNTKEIAAKLSISAPSVFTYRARISEKLALRSPADFYLAASECARIWSIRKTPATAPVFE